MEAKLHIPDERDCLSEFPHIHELFEQLPDPSLLLELRSGIIVTANAAVRDVLGYDPVSLAGRRVDSLAFPESCERESGVWIAVSGGDRLTDVDVDLIDRDGRKVETSVSSTIVRSPNGRALTRIAVFRDISRRRGREREMLADHSQLRVLAYELSVAEERERKRIASGLHDEIGQVLAIAKLKLGELNRSCGDAAAAAVINDVHALVDEASRAARTATFDLSCPVLQQLGLKAAIENLGSRMRRTSRLRVSFSSDIDELPFPAETAAILYRATRELLFNVDKHAHARTARIDMRRSGGQLLICIEDDGVGFEPREKPVHLSPRGGFGLISITAQMRGIGGDVDIASSPGGGTRIVLRVPVSVALSGLH